MDRVEALSFLGLKEPVSKEVITAKYSERKNYFQMLYENAPSKVIEKIQQQNLNKLALVKQALMGQVSEVKESPAKKFETPVIKPDPLHDLEPEENPVLGWLIVHTENRQTRSYNLYKGVNYIGRKKKEEAANCIVIEDDPFISRTHAFIKCSASNTGYEFKLYDGNGNKPSINGVYLNGNEQRITRFCVLKEDDTIQLGNTKLKFRENKVNTTESQEVEAVLNTNYINTIDVEKMKSL
jgi:hypothetical protein